MTAGLSGAKTKWANLADDNIGMAQVPIATFFPSISRLVGTFPTRNNPIQAKGFRRKASDLGPLAPAIFVERTRLGSPLLALPSSFFAFPLYFCLFPS